MIPVSTLIYECTVEEIKTLPEGFQFLEYDTLHKSLRVKYAGMDCVREERQYTYYIFKEPPANWQSPTPGKRSATKTPRVTDKAMRHALVIKNS